MLTINTFYLLQLQYYLNQIKCTIYKVCARHLNHIYIVQVFKTFRLRVIYNLHTVIYFQISLDFGLQNLCILFLKNKKTQLQKKKYNFSVQSFVYIL